MKISRDEYEQLCEIASQLDVRQWDNQKDYSRAIDEIFYHFYHNVIFKNGDIKEKTDERN